MDKTTDEALPRWPETPGRVPYWVYTDRRVYERELKRIFNGSTWNYVALECEIPEPGDYKRTFIGEQSVLVVRDKERRVNVLLNRCVHRGVELCQASSGKVKDFMCPYHQWVYDLEGRLRGVPFKRGVQGKGGMPEDFQTGSVSLKRLAVHVRGGAIFASMGDDPPPFENYLGPTILGFYDRVFDGRSLRLLGYLRQKIGGNWKLMLENIKDPYHASLLHVFFVTFGLFRVDNPSRVVMDESKLHTALASQRGKQELNDGTSQMKSFNAKLVLNGPELLDVEREFPGESTVVMHTIWPNLILQQQSNTLACRQIVPCGPDAFELHWTFFGYATDSDEMIQRRLRQANLMGPGGLVSMDDSEVVARIQDGIRADSSDAGIVEMGGLGTETETDHMVTEVAIRAFYEGYRKVMDL
ncbi:MAG: Rieske 2Fe-2S domain-containing protein [Pigmentiphaga sp.]|uniref:aromatic ring-hydroxylating oxygenase subunit alpha n=1 Tax=Pigmentiphaga sp. TaxID=1977564 RepID=UPI0029AC086C|nr:Rieske 2Fe-2S domain-containing protein [Pigmentiphaga sp.]MDX3906695.1 Rieske 2Fe-2S domain-containing protein [Pigmentiphaga sp.]